MRFATSFGTGWAALVALSLTGCASSTANAQTAQKAQAAAAPKQPNVVYILVDNIAFGSFSSYGGPVPTPRIDELAKQGIRFTNYNVEVQCTPSRSAIMTGRHPVRSGTYRLPMPGQGKPGMVPPMIWEGKKGEPSKSVMPLDLRVRPVVDEKYIIPKTVDYIKRNAAAKKPFFVYVGYSQQHPPVIPNPSFVDKTGGLTGRNGVMAAVIAEMDVRVGQVIDAVKAAGVEDNTIFVLSSDNGGFILDGDDHAWNGPLRGNFFGAPFEGSMRVPAMIRWPGKVPAGVVSDQMLAAVDWLPTLAGMVGASNRVPKDRPIDGVDASAFMFGKQSTTGRDSYVFFGDDAKPMAVKWKSYKTILRYTATSPAIQSGYTEAQFPMSFDLSTDLHEDRNLMWTSMTMAWTFLPAVKIVGEYEASLKKYPNIKMGEDFDGYGK